MKKVITILVFLCLTLAFYPSFADTEDEIRFRGLSWDMPAEEYEKAFYATWFGYTSRNVSLLKEMDRAKLQFFGGYTDARNTIDVKNYYLTLTVDGTMYVGGHNVNQIIGTSLPLVQNGVVSRQLCDYRFANWEYTFRSDDADGVFDDLSSKLSKLYGNATSIENKAEDIEDARLWRGSNDTCAVLTKRAVEQEDGIVKRVYLTYTFSSLADWVAAMNDPSSTVDESSMDGL